MTTATKQTVLDALGIDQLAPEEQEELLLDLGDLIQKGSLIRLIERMDGKTRTAFTKLLDENVSEEEIEDFLAENAPYTDEVVAETVQELQNDILAVTGGSQD